MGTLTRPLRTERLSAFDFDICIPFPSPLPAARRVGVEAEVDLPEVEVLRILRGVAGSESWCKSHAGSPLGLSLQDPESLGDAEERLPPALKLVSSERATVEQDSR